MDYVFKCEGHTFVLRKGNEAGTRCLFHPTQFELFNDYQESEIEVVSRNHLAPELTDPNDILAFLSEVSAPSDVGGWRVLSTPEYAALWLSVLDGSVLMNEVAAGNTLYTDKLFLHPAVRAGVALPFGGAIPFRFLYVLINLYDIRRFVDPKNPTRLSKLKSYFKLLNPQSTFTLLEQRRKGIQPTAETERTALLLDGWYTLPFLRLSQEQTEEIPGCFLYRYYYAELARFKREKPVSDAHALALWRASLYFLTYLRQTWLSGVEQVEFQPSVFFDKEIDVEAYHTYIKKIDNVVDNS